MNQYRSRLPVAAALSAAVVLPGCFGGPSAVKVPPIKPQAVADAALEKYDTNGDGFIAGDELAASPALQDAIGNLDKDKDKRLSRQELVDKFDMWVNGGVGASFLTCRVTKGGRPLEGAQVRLVPESFFADVIQPAQGTTSRTGMALMAIDKANLPSDLQNLRAVQQGLYTVEITHPSMDIPAKYNSATTLGLEVSFEKGKSLVNFKL